MHEVIDGRRPSHDVPTDGRIRIWKNQHIPSPKALRYRGKLPTLRAKYCDDLDTESGRTTVVRRGELAVTERLAVSALGVCGDAPPRRAPPLGVVVQGIHQHDPTSSGDGPRNASSRPRESVTGRSVCPVTIDRASLRCEW